MVTKKPMAKKVAKKAAPKIIRRKGVVAEATIEVVAPPQLVVPLAHPEKQKLVRDSFTMPKSEYDLIAVLKQRLLGLSKSIKKSELLRAGIVALATMSDAQLAGAVSLIPSLKTGRPKKAKDAAKSAKKS